MLIDRVGQSCPAASKRAIHVLAVGFRWCCFIYLHYHIVVYWYSYIMYYLKSYNSLWMNHFIIVHKRWTFVSSYMNTFYLMSGSLMFLWKIIFLLFLFCSVACTGRCLCITNTRCTYKKLTVWNLSLKGKWNLPFHIKYPVLNM